MAADREVERLVALPGVTSATLAALAVHAPSVVQLQLLRDADGIRHFLESARRPHAPPPASSTTPTDDVRAPVCWRLEASVTPIRCPLSRD